VHTGVALVLPQAPVPDGQEGPFCRTFSETTNVLFHALPTELIDAYIHTGAAALDL
jgi:predicted house-cleaning NTP pyrophosphatase (Maf/HAM1 superfamily)